MLDNLTNRFYSVFRNIRGQARLDEENIKPSLREVRLALLEAVLCVVLFSACTVHIRQRLRSQRYCRGHTLPPRSAQRWRAIRLPLGCRAQAQLVAARTRLSTTGRACGGEAVVWG